MCLVFSIPQGESRLFLRRQQRKREKEAENQEASERKELQGRLCTASSSSSCGELGLPVFLHSSRCNMGKNANNWPLSTERWGLVPFKVEEGYQFRVNKWPGWWFLGWQVVGEDLSHIKDWKTDAKAGVYCKGSECKLRLQFSSVTQSCPILCDPMDCSTPGFPHPSSTPGAYSNSCPLHRWYHPTISSSVVPFSSRLQSWRLKLRLGLRDNSMRLVSVPVTCSVSAAVGDGIEFSNMSLYFPQLASLRVLCPPNQCWEVLSSRVVVDWTSWYPEADQWLLGGLSDGGIFTEMVTVRWDKQSWSHRHLNQEIHRNIVSWDGCQNLNGW